MSRIQIRPARGVEVKLCRMLLGHEGSTHPNYHLFVALDDSLRPLAAGSVRSGVEELNELWGVHFQAVPGTASARLDAALLEYARAYAASQGANVLQTLRWFEQGSAEETYWASLGFAPEQLRYAHEIDIPHARERLTPLLDQVREHGWMPPDARIIPLAQANIEDVCDLHLEYLGGSIRHLLPLLDGTAPHPYDRDASVVLLCGEQTRGFTLGWFPDPTICEISANVLHPSVRLGGADLLLKYAAMERVRERNVNRFRFCTAEKHSDSRRTLAWVGGGVTRTEVRLQTACRAN
jgi:hypothetical protein